MQLKQKIKLLCRVIISLLLFVPVYPLLVVSFSMLGIVTMLGLIYGLSGILAIFTDNEEWKDSVKDGWMMVFMPFFLAFMVFYDYIIKGQINID